jgi:hypothetical protein
MSFHLHQTMKHCKIRSMILILVIMVVSFIGLMKASEPADAIGDALVTIIPDQGALHAKVDPSRGGIVTLTGRIDGKQPVDLEYQFVIVDLVAEVEGWEVTKIPSLILTKNMKQIGFSVSVRVPAEMQTSGLDVTKSLRISGIWSYEPDTVINGTVDPVEVFIYVDQFYEYRVRAKQAFIQTSPGGEFDIDIQVTNEGNGDDSVTIEIDRRDELEGNGWAFVFDTTKWDVAYQKVITIPIHIVAPKNWDGYRNDIVVIKINVHSEQAILNNAVSESASYSIFVRQRGVSVPGFEPFLMLLAIMIASMITIHKRRQ